MKQFFQRLVGAVLTILNRANDHHVYLAASGIAFNVMLLMLPTLLVIVFVIGAFVERAYVIQAFDEFFRQSLPFGEGFENIVHAVERELHEALTQYAQAGWIGVPALVWVSLTLFNSIRSALSAVFGMRETGAFWKYILKDLLLLVIFSGALFLVNVFPLVLAGFIRWTLETFPQWNPTLVANVAPILLSKTLMLVFLVLVYRFAPNAKPAWSIVIVSALLYTTLLTLVRLGFEWYLHHFATYNVIYGIYASVVAVAFWLYYTALALLFSAEIAAYIVHPRRQTKRGNYVIHESTR